MPRAMLSRPGPGPDPKPRPSALPLVALASLLLGSLFVASFATGTAQAAGHPTVDGRYVATGSGAAGSVLRLDVAGRGGVPDSASAVVLNVTATRSAGNGYATVYPCGSVRPSASSINFTPGVTIANGIISAVGSDGEVCIYTSEETHLIVDVNGFFPANAQYTPLNPARLLETRSGRSTVDGRYVATGSGAAGSVLRLDVAGRGGVPDSASAVVLNVTATRSAGNGYATVYPCGSVRPSASSINFTPGVTIANGIISAVGSDGEVCIYTSEETHLIVDVNGFFPANAQYTPLNPPRLLETRSGRSTVDGRYVATGSGAAGSVLRLDVAGRGGVPDSASAVVLNVTATRSAGNGYATVYPCGSVRPSASSINFTPGVTIANGIISAVGSDGEVCIYTSEETHLIVDVNGFFPANAQYTPLNPARLLETRSEGSPASPRAEAAFHSLLLLNRLRASYGVGPLVLDPAMANAAFGWSQEMSRSGFRHSGSGYAENIALHGLSKMGPVTAARTLHDMWVDSPGHLANMINPNFTARRHRPPR